MQSLNPFKSKYVLQWLFKDTGRYFPFFSYFLLVLTGFSQRFYSNSLLLNVFHCWLLPLFIMSTWGSGVPLIPPFAPLGTWTNVVPATLVVDPFLISHNFLLLVLLPQKFLVNFLFWDVPRELTFGPSSFKASNLTFSDSAFGCLFLCHFSQVS